ncbi:tyrosine-type recombinase/integrase [Haloplanus rubicundus]|uniref:Site-specific integrase n=1 Tax=Haloplanus rubicundus TaxID=1547898 RepID=A0A345EI35_9EURY|nr:tyrosine-type recombinase/integrase [Haloplanus rubicundus]AXG11857.1 site-specific integrase [Haloplanus rubicundus]
MNLEPIEPEKAVELYLAERETQYADATVRSHRSRLGHLVRWCEENDIDNLNHLTGRRLHEYRIWRRNEGDLSVASEKTQMDTVRVFTRWLASIDGVPPELHQKVQSPSVSAEQNTRHVMLESEDAEAMLDHLEKYEYASRRHVTLSLLWHTMMRRGGARSLDVEDYQREEQCLSVVSRPETGTRIKNGKNGERLIALSDRMCVLLDDWIQNKRPDVTDEHGREPLLATAQGRVSKATIARACYRYTQPCRYDEPCPHDRDPETCDAVQHGHASKCPSSVSPHAIRRGSITYSLNQDVPETAVGDRANVSQEVLDQHYDRRTDREKMELRRQYLDDL